MWGPVFDRLSWSIFRRLSLPAAGLTDRLAIGLCSVRPVRGALLVVEFAIDLGQHTNKFIAENLQDRPLGV